MKILHIHEDMKVYIDDIYSSLKDLENEYPDFYEWYYGKVVPQLKTGKRKIITVLDGEKIAAVMILKDEILEKKICTLRVNSNYRNKGIATKLIKMAMDELNCRKPLITVSELHIKEFSELLRYLGFSLYNKYNNYYIEGVAEYSFNAPIEYINENDKCA